MVCGPWHIPSSSSPYRLATISLYNPSQVTYYCLISSSRCFLVHTSSRYCCACLSVSGFSSPFSPPCQSVSVGFRSSLPVACRTSGRRRFYCLFYYIQYILYVMACLKRWILFICFSSIFFSRLFFLTFLLCMCVTLFYTYARYTVLQYMFSFSCCSVESSTIGLCNKCISFALYGTYVLLL